MRGPHRAETKGLAGGSNSGELGVVVAVVYGMGRGWARSNEEDAARRLEMVAQAGRHGGERELNNGGAALGLPWRLAKRGVFERPRGLGWTYAARGIRW